MTYVKGISTGVLAEQAMAAASPDQESKGFFGRIFSEIGDTVQDVAGTGLEAFKIWSQNEIAKSLSPNRQAVNPAPQLGAAPQQEQRALSGENAMPIAVLAGGSVLLGAALLLRR